VTSSSVWANHGQEAALHLLGRGLATEQIAGSGGEMDYFLMAIHPQYLKTMLGLCKKVTR
jgi:hypothetical protein